MAAQAESEHVNSPPHRIRTPCQPGHWRKW